MTLSPAPLSHRERQALCDLLLEVGPDAPTLCEGWDAADLAAHLVLRERRPDAAVGILVRPLAGYEEKVRHGLREQPFPQLVRTLRAGPPVWSPFGLPGVEPRVNGSEFFVHHEDVRRARPGFQPRELAASDEATLWTVLRRMGRLLFRHATVGVVLRRPDAASLRVRAGAPEVTLVGAASELLLYAFGRGEQARVQIEGDEAAKARFAATPLSV